MKSKNPLYTHGYVHGHVHHHRNHVHIHGHIHNHDHVHHDPSTIAPGDASLQPSVESCEHFQNEFDLCGDIFCEDLDDCYFLQCDDEPASGSAASDRICSTSSLGLDTCFHDLSSFGHANLNDSALVTPENRSAYVDGDDGERAWDKAWDKACGSSSLCQSQRPKLNIFESLINNVQQNIEQLTTKPPSAGLLPGLLTGPQTSRLLTGPQTSGLHPLDNNLLQIVNIELQQMGNNGLLSVGNSQPIITPEIPPLVTNESVSNNELQSVLNTELSSLIPLVSNGTYIKSENLDTLPVHLHFPHHCHIEDPRQGSDVIEFNKPEFHTIHQSCFHAKIPLNATTSSDSGNELKYNQVKNEQIDYDFFAQFNNFSQALDSEHPDQSQILPYALPHNTFACQWDSCARLVDRSSLVDHVVDAHLKPEYCLEDCTNQHPEFECEWDHCNFVDADLNVFLDHLRSHQIVMNDRIGPSSPGLKNLNDTQEVKSQYLSPLLTPTSIAALSESPQCASKLEKQDPYAINITEIKIRPKSKPSCQLTDENFTCKWHVGQDENGEPIICNKTHADEGELQKHLQNDHIGLGHSIYHCCWDGCERNNGKAFAQRQKLHRHIHIHTGHKPCRCEICGNLFAVPAILKQHMRTHSGEKPYKCSMCDKLFATSSSLAIHTRVHLGVKPLKCLWPGCTRYFRESSNLTKHMRTHRTYTCSVCQQQFEKRKDYTKHCRTHDTQTKQKEIVA